MRQMTGQRLDPKRFCRVMTAIENVQAQFFGERKCPMGSFTGDERVHAFKRRLFQLAARAACHYPDVPANVRSSGQQLRGRLQCPVQSPSQFLAFQTRFRFVTNEPAFLEEKRPARLQGQRPAKLRVVAQSRVSVQREMRTVNGQIVFEQQCQQLVTRARPRMTRVPEQSVVHNQQVRPRRGSQLHGGAARVHGGGNAADRATVFHLQTVCRAIPIVELGGAQQTIAMSHDVSEASRWHVRDQSKLPCRSKTKMLILLSNSAKKNSPPY